jgi:Tol biopolymer transport system component
MPLAAGTRLGPYEIVSAVGAGGMGEVYRARDTRLDRTVAVKILRSPQGDFLARFEREAKTISALQHPNICVLHDVGRDGQVDFLVMEYLEGETLAQRLARKPLSLDEALRIAIEVASALDAAHRHGVVHRDLKPGNIMLRKSGAKLMDFGLAKPQGLATGAPVLSGAETITNAASPITAEGVIVGTVQYMSPEQIQRGEADTRSDLFAFGATLYEMVSGKRAFDGKSQISVASAILEKDPAPLATLQPLTPPSLDRLVSKCLAKDPEDRWRDAGDLTSELRWIAETGTHAAAPATGKARPREYLYGVLAIVFLLAAIGGGVSYWRQRFAPQSAIVAQIAPPENARFQLLYSYGAVGGAPAISPDGRKLAFPAVDDSGKMRLWIRPLDSPSARVLPGTEGATNPFWSPDSRMLGFFADGTLKLINVTDGVLIRLASAPKPTGGSWSRDGTILFGPEWSKGLCRVGAGGGTPVPVIAPDGSILASPKFLPDGKHFLYRRLDGAPELQGIHFASVDGNERKLLVRGGQGASYASGLLFYVRGRTLSAQTFDPTSGLLKGDPQTVAEGIATNVLYALFDISETGLLIYQSGSVDEKKLTWYDRTGKDQGIRSDVDDYFDLRLSPDGKKLVSNAGSPNSQVSVDELARSVRTKVTADAETDHGNPVWSPDGSSIIYGAWAGSGNRKSGVYRMASDGAGSEELLVDSFASPSSWSRDGRFVLYTIGDPTFVSAEIHILPLVGDRKPRVLLNTAPAVYDGEFSTNGHWVAYTSRESGRDEVYVVPFDPANALDASGAGKSSRRWQISTSGGRCARWRADGKELFYLSPAGEITAVYIEERSDGLQLGASQVLFRTDIAVATAPYDVTPDGKRFVVNQPIVRNGPMTLIVNWKAKLSKQ